MSLLENIQNPDDIKGMQLEELLELAAEIRETIIKGVSEGGGHLASSLGVVELTIALHYVFDTPVDKLIWDVGHQSYPHKLLTGRYDRFGTLRKFKGISGFPKMSESPFDAFGVGHSSTSISAAVGMAAARDLREEHYKVVAVIGDGAMTAGLAFEGLNHAGQLKKDLVVILNDNEMSISPNVGALSKYLNRILTGDVYKRFKRDTRNVISKLPKFGDPMARFAEKVEEGLKGLFLPGVLFEELGFNYVGPIDGHNLELVIETIENIKDYDRPVLVHVITKKGKGFEFAEEDPCSYHGVGPFEPETGSPIKCAPKQASYSDIMGRTLTEIAEKDPDVVAITAAMQEGTGLAGFAQAHPGRIYDVGIAEPHAVTFAAGLATNGIKPVVAIYSTFLQRSYDEIVHDVCLQGLPVIFAIDRSGLVGEDGPTHHGTFDISYLRHIPGLVFMSPKDGTELAEMLKFAVDLGSPVAIRYPRGSAREEPLHTPIELGRSEVIREGSGLAILAVGNMVDPALDAAGALGSEGVNATVVNVRFLKPLDAAMLERVLENHTMIITVEENSVQGGFGSSVLEYMSASAHRGAAIHTMGIPDEFVEHGSQAELRRMLGLDAQGIAEVVRKMLKGSLKY